MKPIHWLAVIPFIGMLIAVAIVGTLTAINLIGASRRAATMRFMPNSTPNAQ